MLFIFSMFLTLTNANASVAITPLKHELQIEQWNSLTKKIKITNEWDEPITLYTSTEDFISGDSTGQPTFLKPEEQESPELSLANWVEVSEKNITLTVWETREIDFKISIPKDWEPGWHYWAIFFSPWIHGDWKVAYSQRIWVLLLIEVPGKTIIDWKLENFLIWEEIDEVFSEKNDFTDLPIVFNINFKNNWNIHLKPTWKIELSDEDGNILKNIGKETLSSTSGTFIWEKLVDYIPVNDFWGNILPNSDRTYISKWEWFWYTVLNEDWTKTVKFKWLNEYYEDKASENQAYLMFREQIHTKKVTKKITADYQLYYEAKDKNKKEFNDKKEFFVEYNQKYIWLNYYVISWFSVIFLVFVYFIFIYLPKNKKKNEEKLRQQIIKEMKKKK